MLYPSRDREWLLLCVGPWVAHCRISLATCCGKRYPAAPRRAVCFLLAVRLLRAPVLFVCRVCGPQLIGWPSLPMVGKPPPKSGGSSKSAVGWCRLRPRSALVLLLCCVCSIPSSSSGFLSSSIIIHYSAFIDEDMNSCAQYCVQCNAMLIRRHQRPKTTGAGDPLTWQAPHQGLPGERSLR